MILLEAAVNMWNQTTLCDENIQLDSIQGQQNRLIRETMATKTREQEQGNNNNKERDTKEAQNKV